MKRIVSILLVSLWVTGCNAQQENDQNAVNEPSASIQEPSSNQPVVHWDVKKELDENGNIIRYDSTFTWSYTNISGDSVFVDEDSLLRALGFYFDRNMPSLWNNGFDQSTMNDSTLYKDFLNDDYFFNRWEQGFLEMDQMVRRMDSLRNQFFMDTYPGLIEPQQ